MQGASHNRFDHCMCMFVLESHLSIYGIGFSCMGNGCAYIFFFRVVFHVAD